MLVQVAVGDMVTVGSPVSMRVGLAVAVAVGGTVIVGVGDSKHEQRGNVYGAESILSSSLLSAIVPSKSTVTLID